MPVLICVWLRTSLVQAVMVLQGFGLEVSRGGGSAGKRGLGRLLALPARGLRQPDVGGGVRLLLAGGGATAYGEHLRKGGS